MTAGPARTALPTDTAGLPPLDATFRQTLDADLAVLEVDLTPGQRAALETHARLLLAWNEAINLTALRHPDQVAREHVVDSLTALRLVRAPGRQPRPDQVAASRLSLLDLGSGGGYPGLPLGVVGGAGTIALVDSIRKKARFLEVTAAAVTDVLRTAGEPAAHVQVLAERAEALAARAEYRERWDVVTARAVGPLSDLVELALPLLRVGGRLIAWKRDAGLGDELGVARTRLRALRSEPRTAVEVHRVMVPGLEDHRLVVVTKTAQTPARFPRSVAERRRDTS